LQKKMEQCVEERKHLRYKIRADRPEEEIQEMKEGPVSKHRSR